MLFSIILPTFNRASLIPRSLESVLGQTYINWELIIVDDGSTDNTKEIVEGYTDERITYIYQQNQERSAARNRGIHEAKGEWICFLDSDDTYSPDRLEEWATQLKKKKPALYYSELRLPNGDIHFPKKASAETAQEFLLRGHLFCQQSVAHRTVFDKELFNPQLTIGEDTELWIRVSRSFEIIPLKTDALSHLNEHEDRSVNVKRSNPGIKELKSLEVIFQSATDQEIRKKVRKKVKSDTQFSIAKHYMFNSNINEARRWTLRSLLTDWRNGQRKHRLFCLFSLLKGKIPNEYK